MLSQREMSDQRERRARDVGDRYCCGATHHGHISETPATTPDAQIICGTAIMATNPRPRGEFSPPDKSERTASGAPSSAHRIARVSDTNRARVASSHTPTARSRPRNAGDMAASTGLSQPCIHRAPVSNSALVRHLPSTSRQQESRAANENESAAVTASGLRRETG
jgi:hypothetical protein